MQFLKGKGAKEHKDAIKTVALAGNPNVGKSTVFNGLTGLRQHTGNWTGKTVSSAEGECVIDGESYRIADLPGCYSLTAHTAEEKAARDYLLSGQADRVVAVCDATALERNLCLCLQIIEMTGNMAICVNLVDEATKKGISINEEKLSHRLGVQVFKTSAIRKKGLDKLKKFIAGKQEEKREVRVLKYPEYIESGVVRLLPYVPDGLPVSKRWLALRILEGDDSAVDEVLPHKSDATESLEREAAEYLMELGTDCYTVRDDIVKTLVNTAEVTANETVTYRQTYHDDVTRRLDSLLTGKWTGYPLMMLLLLIILWITIKAANYPSEILGNLLFALGDKAYDMLIGMGVGTSVCNMLIYGVYKVLAWVVSVMLPPMIIFFFLFTVLEDAGYLPRIAFNLDKCFKKCGACGKQALTTCMGFGCNAVGVTGTRIIDSPRERLIAVLTNSFMPCNGRFPALIAVISIFFAGSATEYSSMLSAVLLFGVIALGIGVTFGVSKLLSVTVLRGVPSNFTLEIPPLRRPLLGRTFVRSVLDRSVFVLLRAVTVAIPAGLIIWLFANIPMGGGTLLSLCCNTLDPVGRFIGLDGVILMAFILGLPANEIVIPIVLMSYLASSSLIEAGNTQALKTILESNGWTVCTAVCFLIFSLMHWPCATTLMTVKKETGSIKYTILAFILPTTVGVILCIIVKNIFSLIL